MRYYGGQKLSNGLYAIDPDGQDGLEPFEVYCNFPYQTILHIKSESGLFTFVFVLFSFFFVSFFLFVFTHTI